MKGIEDQPTKKSNVVEWKDATGWSEEILFWLLAWIHICEENQKARGLPTYRVE